MFTPLERVESLTGSKLMIKNIFQKLQKISIHGFFEGNKKVIPICLILIILIIIFASGGLPGFDFSETKQSKAAAAQALIPLQAARGPLLYDISQLEAAGLLMSLKYWEVFSYNDLLLIKHYYEEAGKEVEVTSFLDWEDIDIKMDGQTVKDPVTFYFDKERNEEEIYLASVLLLEGGAGPPTEPIGGWPEPPPAEPGKLQWPTGTTIVTSGFGYRIHPITGELKFHNGIDIGAYYEPVYAAADGTVVFTTQLSTGYGYFIAIRHEGLGLSTLYAHLNEYYVEPGDKVVAGQRIAKSGRTGSNTGPHLHFEVRNGLADNYRSYILLQPLNPLDYLPK
ncbi:M23 family metallopeptidase [Patescibacteria group bacterium]|nr:M23 family metallopeptidase [Patescibacteria group bacterium]